MHEIKKDNSVLKSEIHTWTNNVTGEVVEATEISKKVGRQGFMITYLSAIITMIDSLGTKKMKVVKYILENMDKSNNLLIITSRELAEKTETSLKTVTDTLKSLEDSNIITRKVGIIMISPYLIHKGNEGKERVLMTRFNDFKDS